MPQPQALRLSGFLGERVSYQLVFRAGPGDPSSMRVLFRAEAKDCEVRLREVRHVPVRLAAYPDSDDGYISKAPGLYPDLLREPDPHGTWLHAGLCETLWVDVTSRVPGTHAATVTMTDERGQVLASHTQTVTVLPGELPPQKLLRSQWFHADCLAERYHVPVFSEAHWELIERYVRCMAEHGIDTLLTPIHTPPLDTRVGGERLTTQLVRVRRDSEGWHFDLSLLERWVELALRCGIRCFELAHLYTQWGARHAPKIVAEVDGQETRVFGWETDAVSPEYADFLAAYIPALRAFFASRGLEDRVLWHISDEPNDSCLESYRAARQQVAGLLSGCKVMDALSSFAFWQKGVVDRPIVSNDHIEPFLEAGVRGLWTYYCCCQHIGVSNMFIAMPSWRNRAIGVQLWLYRVEGLLQWGYNFYNAQYSDYAIDPYATTDADGWVPAGDPFQVYPGKDGRPEASIRLMVTDEAMRDLRALQWLEELRGREYVEALVHEGLEERITFTRYPKDASYYLALRERLDAEIARCLG